MHEDDSIWNLLDHRPFLKRRLDEEDSIWEVDNFDQASLKKRRLSLLVDLTTGLDQLIEPQQLVSAVDNQGAQSHLCPDSLPIFEESHVDLGSFTILEDWRLTPTEPESSESSKSSIAPTEIDDSPANELAPELLDYAPNLRDEAPEPDHSHFLDDMLKLLDDAPGAAPELIDDTLLRAWFAPQSPVKDETPSFDSEDTENEDPVFGPSALHPASQPLQMEPNSHFTQDRTFLNLVENEAEILCSYQWFSLAPSLQRMTTCFETNVNLCSNAISALTLDCTEFKLGITVCPKTRMKLYTRCLDAWDFMHIIYIAPTSKPWHPESTGKMERRQVVRFRGTRGCLNLCDGGDCPSFGSPHYFYCVTRK